MDKYFNPVRTFEGYGCVKHLTDILEELNIKSGNVLLIVWNESVAENGDIKFVMNSTPNINWEVEVFNKSNPDTEDLFNLYQKTKNDKYQLIVPVGGGSILDIGKSLCCVYDSDIRCEEELRQGIKDKKYKNTVCRWVGVPTTAGTGSEITCWATIWNSIEDSKLSLECKDNYAYAALVDPQFAETMPVSLAVSSALDAVAHATEAYWAKASNLVSKTFALKAVSVIMEHITDLFDNDKAKMAHNYMAQGSMLAGLAFSNTKTTACHSLSYPLTLKYNIPHGTAVSMLISPIMSINEESIEDKAKLFAAFGANNSKEVGERIKLILAKAGIKDKLSLWGASAEDLPELAKLCSTKGRIDNNPVELAEETIVNILKSIY